MGHQHHWCDEPPDGRLYFNKTFDERYGDEEDMATNAYLTSPEELQRLQCLLAKDPNFEHSSNWPKLTEWCSSCTKTRLVRVLLPAEEEKVLEEEKIPNLVTAVGDVVVKDVSAKEACTQTPPRKRKKRGGGGSRLRRLLAYQLMLSERWGLPLSRLLLRSKMKTESKSSKVVLQKVKVKEEPMLIKQEVEQKEVKMEEEKEIKVEKKEESVTHTLKEEKEEKKYCPSMGVSTGESTLFTPRSSQTDANPLSFQPLPLWPAYSPLFFTSQFVPHFQTPQFGLMPAANWVLCGACQTWGSVIPFCGM